MSPSYRLSLGPHRSTQATLTMGTSCSMRVLVEGVEGFTNCSVVGIMLIISSCCIKYLSSLHLEELT